MAYVRFKNDFFYVNKYKKECKQILVDKKKISELDCNLKITSLKFNKSKIINYKELTEIKSITGHTVHAENIYNPNIEPITFIKDGFPFRAFVAVKNILQEEKFLCYDYGDKDDPKVIDPTTINDELTVSFIPEAPTTSFTIHSTNSKEPTDLVTEPANTDPLSSSVEQSYYREWDSGELTIKRGDKSFFLEKGKTSFTLQNQAVSTVAELSDEKTSIIITFDRSKPLEIINFDSENLGEPIYIKGFAKSIEPIAQSIHGEQPVRYANEEIELITTGARNPINPRKRWLQEAIFDCKAKIPNIGEAN